MGARPGIAGAVGLRRLGSAVARAGRAAWSRALDGSAGRFEEDLHEFATELGSSGGAEAIEASLVRLARRIAPGGSVELVRATGERAHHDGGPVIAAGVGDTGGGGSHCEVFRLRCGEADHGVLRLRLRGARALRASRPGTWRRLAIACTMAACALESARLQLEWGVGCGTADDGHGQEPPPEKRELHPRRDVVRDATFLNAVLPFALEQSRRHGEPVTLICASLDRLGAIRDLLGTPMGDRLVGELGKLIASLVRSSDLVARLDDDRIVALLVRARSDGAMKVARSIGRAVADAAMGTVGLPGVSAAIGVAEFPTSARDAASLLDAADEAMAIARARGSRGPVLAGSRPVISHGGPHLSTPTIDVAAEAAGGDQ